MILPMIDKISLITKRIEKASRICIVTHVNPDGDAVGSALALWRVLSVYGKACDCLCDGELPDRFKDVPFASEFNNQKLDSYDLSISVDVSDYSRLGKYGRFFNNNCLSIDHHSSRTSFTTLDWVENYSSCAELVTKLISKSFASYFTKDVAILLYIGLITDCGNFSYEYVNSNSFDVASILVDKGANPSELSRKYITERPINQLRMHSYAINNAVYDFDYELGILVFTAETLQKFGCDLSQTSSGVNELLKADSIKVGISITECEKRKYKISIRSKGDVDAAGIASEFGGGGHHNAAGCLLVGDEGIILDKLIFAVSKYI